MGKSWKKMSPKRSEDDGKVRIRSDVARAAKLQKGAGPHKDRRLARGGSKNYMAEWLEEYEEEIEESVEYDD